MKNNILKTKKIQDFYKSWIFVGSKGFEPLTLWV